MSATDRDPSADPQDEPATPGATLTALWAGLRLVVVDVDVETLLGPDGSRVIEVGVATCRRGQLTSTWSQRTNPGLEVDPGTFRVHGITTEELADEPGFASVEPELTRRLRGIDGEQVVLVAHSAGGDVSALRREYRLIGAELPELPVLDTMRLPRVVGVRPADGGLAALLDELGLSNAKAHSALGDARATAHAALKLLEQAAAQGWADFDALREKTTRGRSATTHTLRGPGPRHQDDEDDLALDFPMEHTAEHNALALTSSSTPADVTAWQGLLEACAHLRCSYATTLVSEAALEHTGVLPAAEAVLAKLLAPAPPADPETGEVLGEASIDVPALTTVLAALEPLLAALPSRSKALAWHDRWLPRLRDLGPCPTPSAVVACPACRVRAGCALDMWPRYLAPAALGTLTKGSRKSFLHLTGEDTGSGVLTTWLSKDRRRLSEAAAWLVHQEHRRAGQQVAAQSFARLAYAAGAREPQLAAAWASLVAAPGGEAQLRRAVGICEEAFLSRGTSTFEGWAALGAKHAQLLGRLDRLRVRPTDALDEDGNPIPARRHHPDEPRRTRPRRFAHGS